MSDTDDQQLKKFYLTEQVKASGMLPSDRLIMMYLIDLAELYGDGQFWFVPEGRTPSHTDLTEWTGLGRSTVKACLNRLERTGWIKRDRPATADALGRGERTGYRLAAGEHVEREKPQRPANPTRPQPAPRPAVGLVQPLAEGRPEDDLGQPLAEGRPAVGSPLGQPLDPPRPAVGHNNQPPTGVGSTQDPHLDQQTPPSTADAAAAAPALPGLDVDAQTPPTKPKPKRKRATKPKSSTSSAPSEGQRVNALARRYTDVVKLSPFLAVAGVVRTAVRSGDYTDEQIGAALDRLADPDHRRSVTANTLRIAIEGDRSRSPARAAAYTDPTDTAGYYEEL